VNSPEPDTTILLFAESSMIPAFTSLFEPDNLLILSESIVQPPISPLVAVTLPVICAAEAVNCPLAPFNFNVPDVASKSVPILNPPIVPPDAVIAPLNCPFPSLSN